MSDVKGIYVGGTPINFKDETSRNLISDVYDTTKQYEIGDYCINNNKLYIATIRPAVGGFDGSCWKETTMSAEVSKQNKKLDKEWTYVQATNNQTLNIDLSKIECIGIGGLINNEIDNATIIPVSAFKALGRTFQTFGFANNVLFTASLIKVSDTSVKVSLTQYHGALVFYK